MVEIVVGPLATLKSVTHVFTSIAMDQLRVGVTARVTAQVTA